MEEAEKGNGMNAGIVFLTVAAQPSFMTYKRDNADFMNNFFVNIIARSFTDIDEFLKLQEENKDQNKQENALKELEKVKVDWKNALTGEASDQFTRLDEKIMKDKQGGEFNFDDKDHKNGVIGAEASLGIKILDKKGEDADIENLIDM